MDDPNITMEEYIRIEEEKARRHNSENDNMPLSPNLTVDYLDDLDYFKDFENEFPAIVYNNGLTSKSDLEINPLVSSERINKFNLIDKASLSEYDEEIVSRFNDLFNIIHPDDSKSEKDNDIGTPIRRIGLMSDTPYQTNPYTAYRAWIWHHYQLLIRDTHGSDTSFRSTLRGLGIVTRFGCEIKDGVFWRGAAGVRESCLEETIRDPSTFGLRVYSVGELRDYWMEISSDRDFLAPAPYYVLIRDPVRRLCHMLIAYSISGRGQAPEKVTGIDLFYLRSMDRGTTNVPHLLVQYLFRHAEGRKSGARMSGGYFIRHLAMHFGIVSDEGLRGLQVVTRELPLIDLHKLGRLNICTRYGDTWAWVAQGPKRQHAAAAGAYEADEAGPTAEEGAQEIPVPAPAPTPAQGANWNAYYSSSLHEESRHSRIHRLPHPVNIAKMREKQDHVKKGWHLRISKYADDHRMYMSREAGAVLGMKRSTDPSEKTLMNSEAAAKHQHEEYKEGKMEHRFGQMNMKIGGLPTMMIRIIDITGTIAKFTGEYAGYTVISSLSFVTNKRTHEHFGQIKGFILKYHGKEVHLLDFMALRVIILMVLVSI
ncbi:zinc finger, CCHC-type containing protein [Tanacetum coccineum]